MAAMRKKEAMHQHLHLRPLSRRSPGNSAALVAATALVGLFILHFGAGTPKAPCLGSATGGGDAQQGDEYDLAVIGGGSGGMAAAKEAARLGAKVGSGSDGSFGCVLWVVVIL